MKRYQVSFEPNQHAAPRFIGGILEVEALNVTQADTAARLELWETRNIKSHGVKIVCVSLISY